MPEMQEHLRPAPEASWWHFFRMLAEAVCCAWFVPRIGRGGKTPDEPDGTTDGDANDSAA